MPINSILKKNLLGLILAATISGCSSSDKEIKQLKDSTEKTKISLKKEKSQIPWENVAEYDQFIRSTVDKYYTSDVKELYSFYNIKRDLPKYGFKANKNEFFCVDCEGALYKEGIDSIYFYSTCSEERFARYTKYYGENNEDIKEELTKRIHYYIKHEAAHAFYCKLGEKIRGRDFFKIESDNLSKLEDIQSSLVEEGVAEYMAYKGELTKPARMLTDKDFKKRIKDEDDVWIYHLGFFLVKPILDINFEKGIEELIKNPLTKKDLYNLPKYREKRIENILKE
jgi:hypothetical protein